MYQIFNSGWLGLNALHPARLSLWLSRLLLLLASIELIAMPWTQHLWTWDRFLHGGQDFETSLLLLLTSLCLIPVLVRACKQGLRLLLGAAPLSGFACSKLRPHRSCIASPHSALSHACLTGPPLGAFCLPLQI